MEATTEKAKVTMRNWEVYVYDGGYNLSVTADEHPEYLEELTHLGEKTGEMLDAESNC